MPDACRDFQGRQFTARQGDDPEVHIRRDIFQMNAVTIVSLIEPIFLYSI